MPLASYPELAISPSQNPEHPQVTVLAKLDVARRDRYMFAPVHLDLEEVQFLTTVMDLPPRELPPRKDDSFFWGPNTNDIPKGLESTAEILLKAKRAKKGDRAEINRTGGEFSVARIIPSEDILI
jgi:hypothetical protein